MFFAVDFLAKYCIFSQEKLAEYKRAFEAVSERGFKGSLSCPALDILFLFIFQFFISSPFRFSRDFLYIDDEDDEDDVSR